MLIRKLLSLSGPINFPRFVPNNNLYKGYESKKSLKKTAAKIDRVFRDLKKR